jgi:hypothetical protein
MGYDPFWKIGFTCSNPETRRAAIQHTNPNEIVILQAWFFGDCKVMEKMIHGKLSKFHHRGEWFKCESMQLVEIIDSSFPARKYRQP